MKTREYLLMELTPEEYPLEFLHDDKTTYDIWRAGIVELKYALIKSDKLGGLKISAETSFSPSPYFDVNLSTLLDSTPFVNIKWSLQPARHLLYAPLSASVEFNFTDTWTMGEQIVTPAIKELCSLMHNNTARLHLSATAYYIVGESVDSNPYTLTQIRNSELNQDRAADIVDPLKLSRLLNEKEALYASLLTKVTNSA